MKLRWLFWILIVAFLWLVISQFSELQKLVQTLIGGRWQWVLIAMVLQICFYLIYTGLYHEAFRTVEVRSRVLDLLPVTFASIFMNVIAPSAGTSGSALFVDDAKRRGESPARAAAGTLLALIADFASFLIVLVVGMAFLFLHHDLKFYQVIGAILLLGSIGGLSAILIAGTRRPDLLQRFFAWIERMLNSAGRRVKRPTLLPENWAQANAAEFTEAALAISAHPSGLRRTLLVGLASHLVNLASLYGVVLAFYHPINPGLLIAGYAMGILFWIVSITPQGIGTVEGVMTLVYSSLGIPLETATVIALAFRGLSFWLPLLVGFIVLRRLRLFQGSPRPVVNSIWSVRIAALITALMGIINVLSAVSRSLPVRFAWLMEHSPLRALHVGRFTAALSGFALLVLAGQLARRKRIAWLATVIILVISAISHLIKGLDFEEAALALALAAWLIYLRPNFHAMSDIPSVRQGLTALVAASLFTLAYGIAGFYMLDQQFKVNFGFVDAARQTIAMFTQFSNPGLTPVTRLGRYFADSIYAIAISTYTYAAWMLIRPVLVRHPATAEERRRAKEIIEQCGRTTLAPFALLEDKHYFFSQSGSAIAYVVEGRVAMTLGDPIGPQADFAACIAEFLSFCARNDWLPSFYQVLHTSLATYLNAGFQEISIGNEAVVDLHTFTLAGGENKNMRTAYNKLTRLGYQAQVLLPPQPQKDIVELRQISDEWLTLVHGTEKRFSLGWFYDDYIRGCPVMVITDVSGSRVAFANILPEFQKKEITIDMMRHRPNVENGTMDFLFVSLIKWAAEQGYDTFSLGLSPLSGVGETPQDSAAERALHYIYEHIDTFYNFKGLHSYKEKFHPAWEPRYLIFPTTVSLPLVALAMIRADSGEAGLFSYLKS